MSIKNIVPDTIGEVGVYPRFVKIECDDSYDTITSAGYLNSANAMGYNFTPKDVFFISYANNAFGEFTPAFNGSLITLNPSTGDNVILPVVNGNIPVFSGTDGLIEDIGISPSDPAQTKLASVDGVTVVAEIATFSDVAGTIESSGFAISNVQSKTNIFAQQLSWAGGSTSHPFVITGLTAASVVVFTKASSANVSTISSYTVGSNTLTVTFNTDPGATVLHAIVFLVAQ